VPSSRSENAEGSGKYLHQYERPHFLDFKMQNFIPQNFLNVCLTFDSVFRNDALKVGISRNERAGVAQSVSRLATGWTVRGSNPGRARFSAPVQTGGANLTSSTVGTGSFPGLKRPVLGVDLPPPSSAAVKGGVELYLFPSSRLSWPVLG
jgi:hypothetical protein